MQKYNELPIDIIITTKNRWSELEFTLDKLNSLGISNQHIYITDDASEENISTKIYTQYPKINFKRYTRSRGLIPNRNELMNWTKAPYILSLDDDSHIRSREDIEEAIDILESHSEYGIFCFKPYEQLSPPPTKEELPANTVKIKSYIGCGHIIKRHVWEEVGQYWEPFEFYCEELDFSIRAFQKGYYTIMKENLVVHHRIDWETRHKQFETDLSKGIYGAVWRSMLGFSNHLLIAEMYFPWPINRLIQFIQIAKRFVNYYIKRNDHKGFIQGLQRFLKLKKTAQLRQYKLSYMQLKTFKTLASF